MLYLITNENGDVNLPAHIWSNILEYTIPPKKPQHPHPLAIEINNIINKYLLGECFDEWLWNESYTQYKILGKAEFINLWVEEKVADFDDWGNIACNIILTLEQIKDGSIMVEE